MKKPANEQPVDQSDLVPTTVKRFDEVAHWPFYDGNKSRSLCAISSCRKLTKVYCDKCQVHLCFIPKRNCFWKFHHQDVCLLKLRKKIANRQTQSLQATHALTSAATRTKRSNPERIAPSTSQSTSKLPKITKVQQKKKMNAIKSKYGTRSTVKSIVQSTTAQTQSIDSDSGSTLFEYLQLQSNLWYIYNVWIIFVWISTSTVIEKNRR